MKALKVNVPEVPGDNFSDIALIPFVMFTLVGQHLPPTTNFYLTVLLGRNPLLPQLEIIIRSGETITFLRDAQTVICCG